MIEPAVRTPALAEALRRDDLAVILLDVVLGFGAHPAPAQPVADTLADAPADRPLVVGYVCGTDADPQRRGEQARILEDAGVVLADSNAHAARVAAAIVRPR